MMSLLDLTKCPPLDDFTQETLDQIVATGFPGLGAQYTFVRDRLVAISLEPRDFSDEVLQRARSQVNELGVAANIMAVHTTGDTNGHQNLSAAEQRIQRALSFWMRDARPHVKGGTSDWMARTAQAERLLTMAKEAATEHEALLVKVRELTSEAGTGELATHYKNQADDHRKAARWALIAVVVMAAAVVGVGWWLISHMPATEDWSVLVRNVLARAFVLGVLSFGVAFASRIYRTNTHLRAVYEQKANALRTFSLFARSVDDEDARSLILAELVRAVFSSADTGVLDKGSDHTIVESAIPIATAFARQKA
ncbi:hypothetical protein ACFWFR_00920 [Oerskovia sp. NPDC060287]|uniref:hypothetical protein n=1 Tax=Oerskovia sp. NPDC060287 TaxID=3347095 RepID=UPI00364F9452